METDNRKRRKIFIMAAVRLAALLIITMGISGCGAEEPKPSPGETELTVFSAAFQDGGNIPAKYTCDGEDISPQIAWEVPPSGTRSLSIIMDDLDASRGFTHWVVYNIPPNVRELAEAIPAQSRLEDGTMQGKNSFNKTGYGGPCPPSGTHRYQFSVYALDTMLDLEAGASKKQVTEAMEGHILARGALTGKY